MRSNMTINQREKGFTLTEMIIVLGVVSILSSAAIPGFGRVISGSQIDSAANELYSAMGVARSEAITRARNVSICTRASDTACAGNSNWATGWLVFIDTDFDGVRDAGEEILFNHSANFKGVDFVDSVTGGDLTFRSDGSVGSSNEIDVCGDYNTGIRIAVGAPGRITTRGIEGGNCAS